MNCLLLHVKICYSLSHLRNSSTSSTLYTRNLNTKGNISKICLSKNQKDAVSLTRSTICRIFLSPLSNEWRINPNKNCPLGIEGTCTKSLSQRPCCFRLILFSASFPLHKDIHKDSTQDLKPRQDICCTILLAHSYVWDILDTNCTSLRDAPQLNPHQ